MSRRSYSIGPLDINRQMIEKVVIDGHVDKHSDHISDELILELVKELDGQRQLPEDEKGNFRYFSTIIKYLEKKYKLVWLLEKGEIYIGVITVFKDRRHK